MSFFIKDMKTVAQTLILSIMIVLNTQSGSSVELVRGGNLDTVESRLEMIEEHHIDLEQEETLLEALKTKSSIPQTEIIMEDAVDRTVYSNEWNEPRAEVDEYVTK